MTNIQQSIRLNNEAVALLQLGRHKEAIGTIRKSLSLIRERFCEANSARGPPQNSPGSDSLPFEIQEPSVSFLAAYSSVSMKLLQDPLDDETMQQDDQDSSMELEDQWGSSVSSVPIPTELVFGRAYTESDHCAFDRALLLSPDVEEPEVVSSVLIFNMSLVNHGRGLSRGDGKILSRCLHLYRLSLSIIRKAEAFACSTVNLLLLALFNNLGQIHCSLCDRKSMMQCLDCMNVILHSPGVWLDPTDYDFFYVNAVINMTGELGSAPAA